MNVTLNDQGRKEFHRWSQDTATEPRVKKRKLLLLGVPGLGPCRTRAHWHHGEFHGPRTLQEIESNPDVKVSKGSGRRHTRNNLPTRTTQALPPYTETPLHHFTSAEPSLGRTEIMHTFMDCVPLNVSSRRMNNTRSIFYKYKWWDNVELMKSQSAISLKTCCKHLNFFFSQPCILWRIL